MHCGSNIYGFGDSTGGRIWQSSILSKMSPLGGAEKMTNFPSGDNLYSPVNYIGLSQATMIKVSSTIAGPVCGYNLSNIFGYLATAILMLLFIYYLTKNKIISLIAGYAVSFTPYIQSVIGGHPSYSHSWILIGIIWSAYHFMKFHSKKSGFILAIILGFCSYFDPYFSLMSATVLFPIFLVYSLYFMHGFYSHRITKNQILKILKNSALSLGLLIILLSPLLYVGIKENTQINASVGGQRGSVYATAMMCSNLPLNYLIPDPNNIFFIKLFGPHYTARNIALKNWCNYGESRTAISLTMLFTILCGAMIICWEKLNRRRLKLSENLPYNVKPFIISLALILLLAFLIGLPPKIDGYLMLSGIVLKITQTWRVFAREYIVINLIVVILFTLILNFLASQNIKFKKYILSSIYLTVFLSILIEYQINPPFSPLTFNYNTDISKIYKTIKTDNSINSYAEYPIDRTGIEADSLLYYLTMQSYDRKPIFNSAGNNPDTLSFQNSLKALNDPQTIPILRYLGIKYIVIHGVSSDYLKSSTSELQLIQEDSQPIFSLNIIKKVGTTGVLLTKIVNGNSLDHALVIKHGLIENLLLFKDPFNIQYQLQPDATLMDVPLLNNNLGKDVPICFDAKNFSSMSDNNLKITINNKAAQSFSINGEYKSIRFVAKEGDVITLHNPLDGTLINSLGCK
ncbi:MAG: hypothetical protein WCG30_00805 [Candidatus Saccharibacteria bacterium]